jgi:hypothetical protein
MNEDDKQFCIEVGRRLFTEKGIRRIEYLPGPPGDGYVEVTHITGMNTAGRNLPEAVEYLEIITGQSKDWVRGPPGPQPQPEEPTED